MTSRTAPSLDSIPIWLVVLMAAAWVFPGLIGHDPWKPDEAYSFGLVYHILQTGDWIVPTLAGEPFMEKPPLFYFTAALFAKIFSNVLPLHDGARLASGFYIALTLLFTGLAARELYGQGRAAVLALLACLGLAPWAHLLITDTALLAGLALGLYGFALGMRRHLLGGLCLGTGAGIAFLSKGLLGPGLLGLAALILPALHPTWRARTYLVSLLVAVTASLPWLLIWPVALYLRSPELFSAWIWDNNFGRFFGSSGLGPKQETLFYLRTLPWFAWPAWLLALATPWAAGRESVQQPSILLPTTLLAITLVALIGAADARQVYALPLLLPFALLAARTAGSLPRVAAALYWLGIISAVGVLIAIWGIWLSPELVSSGLSGNDASRPALLSFPVLGAFLYSIGGMYALYLTRRSRERVLAAWALATTLFVGLAMTLLLGWINDQKSYRNVFTPLGSSLPSSYDCVVGEGLGEPQRAMIEYYAGLRTLRQSVHPDAKCGLILRQEWLSDPPMHDPREWRILWEGRHPGGSNEKFRLYQRY